MVETTAARGIEQFSNERACFSALAAIRVR
jgi:hypothetical protein